MQRLGPRPRTLLELEAPQRMLRPVFLEEDVLVVPITEPGLGLVRRGPTALCVVSSPGGARRAAVEMGRGQPRVLGGDLVLEGGTEVLVFEGAARGLRG